MTLITEKTGVPLGAVVSVMVFLITVAVGATIWVTTVNFKMGKIDEIHNDVKKISKDMTYVKGALGITENVGRKVDERLTKKSVGHSIKKAD